MILASKEEIMEIVVEVFSESGTCEQNFWITLGMICSHVFTNEIETKWSHLVSCFRGSVLAILF